MIREVRKIYLGTGIFVDFDRASVETVVKKTKTFKQAKFLRGYAPVDENSQSTLGFQDEEEMKDETGTSKIEEEKQ